MPVEIGEIFPYSGTRKLIGPHLDPPSASRLGPVSFGTDPTARQRRLAGPLGVWVYKLCLVDGGEDVSEDNVA